MRKINQIDENCITMANNLKILENKKIPFKEYGVDAAEFYPVCDKKSTNITLSSDINIIGSFAFADCNKLTEIIIPENVFIISGGAFYNCSALKKVMIKNPETYISNQAFMKCAAFTIYGLSDSSVSEYARKHNFLFKEI